MMKKVFVFVGAFAILSGVLASGCTTKEPAQTTMPPLNGGGQQARMIELLTDDFMTQNHISQNVELTRPGSLIVSLGSNPATGFEWSDAQISDNSIVAEQSFVYVPSQVEDVVGAPGKNVWVFDSQSPGTSTINMSYSRPWEGGEKDQWTLTINVTVK